MSNPIFDANPPNVADALQNVSVAIFGCGGIGSNAAMLLVRAGVRSLQLTDFDRVAPSNLNRQFFFADQLGTLKTEALASNLRRITPNLQLSLQSLRFSPDNADQLIPLNAFDLVLECFDNPVAKADLTRFMLAQRPNLPLLAISGIAGLAPTQSIRVTQGPGKLWIIGDAASDASILGTLSSRVMIASALQAHTAIRILLGLPPNSDSTTP